MVVPAQHTSRSACRAAFVASACARVVRCHDAKQRVADRAGCIALRPAPCAPTAPWVACVYRARLASRSDRTHRGPSRPNRPRRPHAPDGPEGFGRCPSGTFRAQAVCHTQAVADAQWGPGPPKRPQGTPRESGAASPEVLGPARRQAPRLDEMAATAMPAAQIGPHASAHLIGFSAFEGDQCCQWRCAVTGPKVTQSRQTTGICPEGRRTIVLLSIPALCQTLR